MLPSLKYKEERLLQLQNHNRLDPPSASRSQAQASPPNRELCDQCELNRLFTICLLLISEFLSIFILIDLFQNLFQAFWNASEGLGCWLDQDR
jgi:hypothetical protein